MKLRETISWLMGTLQRGLFPYFEECSEAPLTAKQKQLLQILEIVQVEKSVPKTAAQQWMGRKIREGKPSLGPLPTVPGVGAEDKRRPGVAFL